MWQFLRCELAQSLRGGFKELFKAANVQYFVTLFVRKQRAKDDVMLGNPSRVPSCYSEVYRVLLKTYISLNVFKRLSVTSKLQQHCEIHFTYLIHN